MSRPIPYLKEIFQIEDIIDRTAVAKEMDDNTTIAPSNTNINKEEQQHQKSATTTPVTQQQHIDHEEDNK